MQISLRPASTDDTSALASLVGELGYQATEPQIEERLAVLLHEDRYFLVVATDLAGRVIGLVNAEIRLSIESGVSHELTGLVVSSLARGAGVGAALVSAAEQWALAHGANQLRVRSNVVRPEAHSFYAGRGYALQKTQHCYVKPLRA